MDEWGEIFSLTRGWRILRSSTGRAVAQNDEGTSFRSGQRRLTDRLRVILRPGQSCTGRRIRQRGEMAAWAPGGRGAGGFFARRRGRAVAQIDAALAGSLCLRASVAIMVIDPEHVKPKREVPCRAGLFDDVIPGAAVVDDVEPEREVPRRVGLFDECTRAPLFERCPWSAWPPRSGARATLSARRFSVSPCLCGQQDRQCARS